MVRRLWIADTPIERSRGLLGRGRLPVGEALLITRCSAVHTFGMRFCIDVAFLDAAGTVVRARRGVKPWRLSRGGADARCTLEAESGWLSDECFQVGTRLRIEFGELS